MKKTIRTVLLSFFILLLLITISFSVLTCTLKKEELSDIRGVNLGSWLVLEKWMTPEVFDGTDAIDEYTLARTLSSNEYENRIKQHRRTYITEKDFEFLSSNNINLVRIPVPYYIFGDRTDEPYIGCIEELDMAFDWAEKYNIQILIDMHMVPGSQNGFDNGGINGICTWAQTPDEVEYVLNILEQLTLRYGNRNGFFGIQPLNEPLVSDQDWADMDVMDRYPPVDENLANQSAPISMNFLKEFYLEAYDRLRPLLPDDKWIVFHDAFQMWNWFTFMSDKEYHGVIFDTHVYLFNIESVGLKGPFWHKAFVWGNGLLMSILQTRFPVICGEWSIFNNYSYEISDQEELSNYYKEIARLQIDTWDQKGAGSIFWNYKLGTAQKGLNMDAWNFQKCIENGWISYK